MTKQHLIQFRKLNMFHSLIISSLYFYYNIEKIFLATQMSIQPQQQCRTKQLKQILN